MKTHSEGQQQLIATMYNNTISIINTLTTKNAISYTKSKSHYLLLVIQNKVLKACMQVHTHTHTYGQKFYLMHEVYMHGS